MSTRPPRRPAPSTLRLSRWLLTGGSCWLLASSCNAQYVVSPPYDVPAPPVRIAFLVGNSDYGSVSKLDSVAADLDVVEETLVGSGFEIVFKRRNAARHQLVDELMFAIDEQLSALGADERAIVVIYFGGHGGTESNELQLIPTDFCPYSDQPVFDRALPISTLTAQLTVEKVAGAWLLIDACRSSVEALEASEDQQCRVGARTSLPNELKSGKTLAWKSPQKIGVLYSTVGGEAAYGPTAAKQSAFVEALRTSLGASGESTASIWYNVGLLVEERTRSTSRPMLAEVANGSPFVPRHSDASRRASAEKWAQYFEAGEQCWYARVHVLEDYNLVARRWLRDNTQECSGVNSIETAASVEDLVVTGVVPTAVKTVGHAFPTIELETKLPESLKSGPDPVARVELGNGLLRMVRRSGIRQIRNFRVADASPEIRSVLDRNAGWRKLTHSVKEVSVANADPCSDSPASDDSGRMCSMIFRPTSRVVAHEVDSSFGRTQPIEIAVVAELVESSGARQEASSRAIDEAVRVKLDLMHGGRSAEDIDIQLLPNSGNQIGNFLTASPDGAIFVRATDRTAN